MKKNDFNAIKDISVDELSMKLKELQEKLFKLKLHHSIGNLKNPMEIRKTKRSIAKIKTIIFIKIHRVNV
ncbi:MAG: 50S ribosomal protein L29 [Endomicrobium sp.]|jgi:large subunit ribosomal protein L29|nr:50S ribosomal protein L29 [Endomicrobium sp.]